MAERLDSLGVKVEVGDIVFSAPRHKWSGKPEVGRVSGVFDSGRVTIQVPDKVSIYAHERGAPDREVASFRYDRVDGQYVRVPYTYMAKDYTVVDHEWRWLRKQAADLTLIVLRKGDSDLKSLAEVTGIDTLTRGLALDYDAVTPQLD